MNNTKGKKCVQQRDRKPPRYMTVRGHRLLKFVEEIKTDPSGNLGHVYKISGASLRVHNDWPNYAGLYKQYRISHIRASIKPTNYVPIALAGVISDILPVSYNDVLQIPGHKNQVLNGTKIYNFHYNQGLDVATNPFVFVGSDPKETYFVLRSFSGAQANFSLGFLEISVYMQFSGFR